MRVGKNSKCRGKASAVWLGDFDDNSSASKQKCRSIPNFTAEVDLRRYGFATLSVEIKLKGGNRHLAPRLTKSHGVFKGIPTNNENAEQLKITGAFLTKNRPFGNYSPVCQLVILP